MSKPHLTITVSPLFAGLVALLYGTGPGSGTTSSSCGAPSAQNPSSPLAKATVRPSKRKRDDMEEGPSSPSIPRIIVRSMRMGGEHSRASPIPPSPVPTEIEEERIHVCQAEATAAAIAAGVKVRDFAYEPSASAPGAPEVWRAPLHTLVMHDRYIRAGPSWRHMLKLPGKMLWRLLHSGLVTQEEVRRNWTVEDRKACDAYQSRPGGPYPYVTDPPTFRKPTAECRRCICYRTYPPVPKDDVPENQIYMPPDTEDMDDGALRNAGDCTTVGNSLAAPPTSESVKAPSTEEKDSPQTKKRRVDREPPADTTSPSPAGGTTAQEKPSLTSTSLHESAGSSRSLTPPRPGQAHAPDTQSPLRPLRRGGLTRTETVIFG